MFSRFKWVLNLLGAMLALSVALAGCEETPAARLRSIALEPVSVTLYTGTTEATQIRATGAYDDGSSRDVTARAEWASSQPNVVIVNTTDARGAVRAAGMTTGMATVTATFDGVTSAPATVTVLPSSRVTALVIEPATATVPVGVSRALHASATYADGRVVDVTSGAAWTSSDDDVLRVDSGGMATGVRAGTAEARATFQGMSASAAVTVSAATLQRVEVDPRTASAAIGTTVQFRATGIFSDGSNQPLTGDVTWTSSMANVATVDASGVARGVAAGTAIVRAESGGVRGEATLVVTAAALRAIAVTPASVTVSVGGTAALTATGTYSDGTTQNITSLVGWTSADAGVVTVSSLGQVLGLRAGDPSPSAPRWARFRDRPT